MPDPQEKIAIRNSQDSLEIEFQTSQAMVVGVTSFVFWVFF